MSLVPAYVIVETEKWRPTPERASGTDAQSFKYTSSYFTDHQSRLTKTLSKARPQPPMLIPSTKSCYSGSNDGSQAIQYQVSEGSLVLPAWSGDVEGDHEKALPRAPLRD